MNFNYKVIFKLIFKPKKMEKQKSKHHQTFKDLIKEPGVTLALLMDHDDFTQQLKYQTKQLDSIINYHTIKQMITYIIKTGPLDDQKRSYKLPLVASQALCLQLKNFSEYLFEPNAAKYPPQQINMNTQQQSILSPLIEYFLSFLQEQQNYVLIGYFCKVLISIVKRFHGVQTKYNQRLCQYLFSRLDKIYKHLYSKSTNELLLKILTLKSKSKEYLEQKRNLIIKLSEALEQGTLSIEIMQNLVLLFEALINNTYSQKINYDITEIIFSEDVLKILFRNVGNSKEIKKYKTSVINLYLKKFKTIIQDNLDQNYRITSLRFIANQDGKNLLKTYISLLLTHIQFIANNSIKVTIEELYLIESLDNLILLPIPNIKHKSILTSLTLKHLFKLIQQNPWNNILHNLVLKVTRDLINLFKTKQSQIELLLETISESLISFNHIFLEEQRCKVGYTHHIEKISGQISQLMEAYQYEKSQEWAAFQIKIYELISRNNQYQVGEFSFKPYFLTITYNRQGIAKNYMDFLSKDTEVQYQEVIKPPKEKQFEELKHKKLEEMIKKEQQKTPSKQNIQILEFEVEQEFQTYKYWKDATRIQYDVDELINEI